MFLYNTVLYIVFSQRVCVKNVRIRAKNTGIPRVPQCLSPRPNWDPSPPLQQASVSLPRNQRGEGHTLLPVGGGWSKFGRLEKKPSTLSILCIGFYILYRLRLDIQSIHVLIIYRKHNVFKFCISQGPTAYRISNEFRFLVLSLFTVVSFKNDACMSTGGTNGTCFSSKDCTLLGKYYPWTKYL
jgi:hypothetical protein